MTSRAALITGCSSGIGRATALALHQAGYPVYATARRPEVIADLADQGITTLSLDVTDESWMTTAVNQVVEEHGAVGILVNNAGYGLQGTIEETPLEEVRAQFETNVFGLARLTQLALPSMREQKWGRIINIGSMGGRFTFPGGGYYHASKHAVESLSDALRLEVAPFGIKVVLVQPGPVRSEFGATAVGTIESTSGESSASPYGDFSQELAQRYSESYDESVTNRTITPDDVAGTILRAVTSEHPRARYAVGAMARALITGRRLLPDQAWDAVIKRSWPTPTAD